MKTDIILESNNCQHRKEILVYSTRWNLTHTIDKLVEIRRNVLNESKRRNLSIEQFNTMMLELKGVKARIEKMLEELLEGRENTRMREELREVIESHVKFSQHIENNIITLQ